MAFAKYIQQLAPVSNAKTKDTVDKSELYPNELHQFASYNALFTLSALSQSEIENPKTFFKSAPHQVIIRSSGIGGNKDNDIRQFDFGSTKPGTDRKLFRSAISSAKEFNKQNDLYFRNVEMIAVPGNNDKRRITSVTQISMEIVEPYGLTLLDKIRAAALANGFKDHTDAPYLLTVDFQGFDALGKPVVPKTPLKRVIPIKLITMDIDVNQGASIYNMTAVPYNEFAFTNLYLYPRTSGSLLSTVKTIDRAVVELQKILNDQNKDEKLSQLQQRPDEYELYVDEAFKIENAPLDFKQLAQVGMAEQKELVSAGEVAKIEFLKFSKNNSVMKILEELMKNLPELSPKAFDEWYNKVVSGADGVSSFYKYFRIRSSIVPTKEFDEIRQTMKKKIKMVVEPFYIHAMSLAAPGVAVGDRYKSEVKKKYNYIFTGENVDILEVNINYKVAFYQTKLKDVEAADGRKLTDGDTTTDDTDAPENPKFTNSNSDHPLHLKSEVGGAKSTGAGGTGGSDARLDQFLDAIANPTADMVVVQMQILGDPSYLGQSQFMPAAPKGSKGISTDDNIAYFRGGDIENLWNPDLKCFNGDAADPVVQLNFKLPTDIDTTKGTYEISSAQQAAFSGLYRVVQVNHSFDNGQFTQNLTMVRYNNQNSKPNKTRNKKITKKFGEKSGPDFYAREQIARTGFST